MSQSLTDYSDDCNECENQLFELYIDTNAIDSTLQDLMPEIGLSSSAFHANLIIDHFKSYPETILYTGEKKFATDILTNLLIRGISSVKVRKAKP